MKGPWPTNMLPIHDPAVTSAITLDHTERLVHVTYNFQDGKQPSVAARVDVAMTRSEALAHADELVRRALELPEER